MEIEKKYLCSINQIDIKKIYKDKVEIEQSYICIDPVIRLRKYNKKFYLTVKSKGHIQREEYELEISREQYIKLLSKVEYNTIRKTRYLIPIQDNLIAELDIYYGELQGLITVEVEFKSIEQAKNFKVPNWFGKDISCDANYKNAVLSMNGLPKSI